MNYTGVLSSNLFVEATYLQPQPEVRQQRRLDHRHRRRHAGDRPGAELALLVADVLRRLRPRRGAQQREHRPEGNLVRVDRGYRLAQRRVRLRHLQRHAARREPSVGQRLPHPGHDVDHPRQRGLSELDPRRPDRDPVEPDRRGQPGHELPDPFAVPQRSVAPERPVDAESRAALGQERRRRQRRATPSPTTAGSRRGSRRPSIRPAPASGPSTPATAPTSRARQQRRRQPVERRHVVDVPVPVPRAGHQHRPQRADREPDSDRPGPADPVRLVQRQRRHDAAGRRGGDSRSQRADRRLAALAERAGSDDRRDAPARLAWAGPRRRDLPQLDRLLLLAPRHGHRHGQRSRRHRARFTIIGNSTEPSGSTRP